AARGGDFYARAGSLLLAAAAEVLDTLDVLDGGQLVGPQPGHTRGTVRWSRLVGDGPAAGQSELPPEVPAVHPGCVYVLPPGERQRPVPLHPLVLTGGGDAARFFFSRGGAGPGEYEYLDYPSGVVERVRPGWGLDDLLAGAVPGDPEPARPAGPGARRTTLGGADLRHEWGRGRLGWLHRGRQRALGRDVAVRWLWPEVAQRVGPRVHEDAWALSRLELPNLPRVFAAGIDGEDWYYVME